MTKIYFVRHAESNSHNHDDRTRELTKKGMQDRKFVTDFLSDKKIEVVLSSPYKRAVDTVQDFADRNGLKVGLVEDFRERRVDSGWIEDFNGFCQRQWNDFSYKFLDGECLQEVQKRNISALHQVLADHEGKNIAVGSHGTALSTIINYFDPSFGYQDFEKVKGLMPWIVLFIFDENQCIGIEKINILDGAQNHKT